MIISILFKFFKITLHFKIFYDIFLEVFSIKFNITLILREHLFKLVNKVRVKHLKEFIETSTNV